MGPSRPNPLGGWGLRAISLSFVVDVPLHRLLLSSRPHLANPIRIRHRIYGREYLGRLLVSKGFDGIQSGSFMGGVIPEKDSDPGREEK